MMIKIQSTKSQTMCLIRHHFTFFLKPSLGIQSVIMYIIFHTTCKHKHQYEINIK